MLYYYILQSFNILFVYSPTLYNYFTSFSIYLYFTEPNYFILINYFYDNFQFLYIWFFKIPIFFNYNLISFIYFMNSINYVVFT